MYHFVILFVIFPVIWKCCIPFFGTFEKMYVFFAGESTKLVAGSYGFEAGGGTEQKSKHWECFIH